MKRGKKRQIVRKKKNKKRNRKKNKRKNNISTVDKYQIPAFLF